MSGGGGSKRWLLAAVVWVVLLGIGVAAYRLILAPWLARSRVEKTSSAPRDGGGAEPVRLALDSFSGYAVFRSQEFRDELAAERLDIELVDDGADYARRFESLRDGATPLALFTIDALLDAFARHKDLPATIVLLVDETRGADAMVARRDAVPTIDGLNHRDARIVLTPDSPSETLARVVQAHFRLPELAPATAWVPANGAADVFRRLRAAGAAAGPTAYVLWEPYVSRALEDPAWHVLIDSSRFQGYIVDVLVCQRDFLLARPEIVAAVVRSYLRALFTWRQRAGGMQALVLEDARRLGEAVSDGQAERLVGGIWWKNTQENYAHFGLLPADESRGVQPIDGMIRNIQRVLQKTGGLAADPTAGQPHVLYYDRILGLLRESGFHPGLVAGAAGSGESIRRDAELPALRDDQWQRLAPIGTLEIDALVFARGTATLTDLSRRTLEDLAVTLRDWPLTYLEIRGHARGIGDPEANRRLAEDRAKAALAFLVDAGVAANRVRAVSTEPRETGGEAQSVTFVLGQVAF